MTSSPHVMIDNAFYSHEFHGDYYLIRNWYSGTHQIWRDEYIGPHHAPAHIWAVVGFSTEFWSKRPSSPVPSSRISRP